MGWVTMSERKLNRVVVLAQVDDGRLSVDNAANMLDLTRGLVGKYVDVYEMPDGRIQVRAKGVVLPCSVFDPHQQRVTHAAIAENKHLSAVLAHIKEEQEKAAPPPKVKPVSAKNGYKKTGRRPPGRPSKMEAYYEHRRAERAAQQS